MKTICTEVQPLVGEFTFYVGTNDQDNFDIIRAASETDIWFHVSGRTSEHVIAVIPNTICDKKQLAYLIKRGAVICKQHSKYASEKKLPIIYSRVKTLELTEVVGSVYAPGAKTIVI